MWVVQPLLYDYDQMHRITPTYVGSTKFIFDNHEKLRDHPHVCGQYVGRLLKGLTGLGSPPRMWVVQESPFRVVYTDRITPTYVGSTDFLFLKSHICQDHPHVCGQYMYQLASQVQKMGSPPRMWVVQINHYHLVKTKGITPTYVGSTQL